MNNFTWANSVNGTKIAKILISSNIEFIVNFIPVSDGVYDCYFYPSINTLSNYKNIKRILSINDREKIFLNIFNIIKDFTIKYYPYSITFTPQFNIQVSKLSSITVDGYTSETVNGVTTITKIKQ